MASQSERMESILDASVVLIICLVGIVSNMVSAVVLTHNRAFRNPFGMLTTVHVIANIGVLSIFAFWAVPLMLISPSPNLPLINKRLGQLSLFFVEAAFHACLFISLNRLTAISSPSFYRNRFTVRLTFGLIVFIMVISLLYWTVYFFPECDFYFDARSHIWTFADTDCGNFVSKYCDMKYNVSLFILIATLDLRTLVLLQRASKKLGASSDSINKRNRREIRFFAQAFINTVIYAFMLICFHVISYKLTSNFGIFLATTGIWGFSHCCGGPFAAGFTAQAPFEILRCSLVSGLALLITQVIIQNISGSHLNPAVSLAHFIHGRLSGIQCFSYICLQLFGCFIGSAGHFLIVSSSVFEDSFLPHQIVREPNGVVRLSVLQGFLLEALMIAIFCVVHLRWDQDDSLIVPATWSLVSFVCIPLIGLSCNVALSLSSTVVHAIFLARMPGSSIFYLPPLASLLGSFLSSLITYSCREAMPETPTCQEARDRLETTS